LEEIPLPEFKTITLTKDVNDFPDYATVILKKLVQSVASLSVKLYFYIIL